MQELLQYGEDGVEQKKEGEKKGGGGWATRLGMSHQHPWVARDMVTLRNTVFWVGHQSCLLYGGTNPVNCLAVISPV